MSAKKLNKALKAIAKRDGLSEDYEDGGNMTRHYYDSGLREIFGRLGLKISNYILEKGIKADGPILHKKKKRK